MSAQSFTPFEYVSLIFQGIYFSMSESVPEQITVTSKGVGSNQNEAVESALNSAVQKAVGVLVLSEQSAKNDRVIRIWSQVILLALSIHTRLISAKKTNS